MADLTGPFPLQARTVDVDKMLAAEDFAIAAEGSKNAASTAASTANAHRLAAEGSATAAAGSASAAETAKTGAETARDAAAGSATAAAGSASAAAASAATAVEKVAEAETAATTATTQAGLASADRAGTEAARDAAIAAGAVVGTYSSTAVGLAAVSEEAKFWAPSNDGKILQQYTKTSGAAVAVSGVAVPTASAIADVNQVIAPAAGRIVPIGSEILWRPAAAIPVGWYDTKERLSLGSESRAVLSNVFDPTLDDVVSELTDPTLPFNLNRTVVLLTDPVTPARCDGTKWVNVSTGLEITPWWLPPISAMHIDLENGRFYWGGAQRSLADLTGVSAEAFTLDALVALSGGATIVCDYIADPAAPPTGNLLWIGAASGNIQHRLEWQTSGGANSHRFYSTQWAVGGQYVNIDLCSKNAEGVSYPGTGRHRIALELEVGQTVRQQTDNGTRRGTSLPRVVASLPDFARFGFNVGRAWGDGSPQTPATNQSLKRVTIYPRILSTEHVEAIGRTGKNRPKLFLGDSFLNLYKILHAFSARAATGGYIGLSQDGVGGTTMPEMLARYAAGDPKWWKSGLIWLDAGISNSSADMIAAIEGAKLLMDHDEWAYMEPAPQAELGTPTRAAWDAMVADMRAYCGDRFIPTLELAYAAGNGSAEDNAEIAKGLHPLSLKKSGTDFHASDVIGADFWAKTAHDWLVAKGWA